MAPWIALAGAVLLGWAVWAVSLHATPEVHSPETAVKAPAVSRAQTASSRLMFFGNVYFGRYINDWSMASGTGYAYPFSRLSEFHRENYDAWVAGLECPTVTGFTQSSAAEDTTLSFNCDPAYLKEARKWFTAFTLANNHTDNRGAAGLAETRQHLEENDIQYFGDPDPRSLKDTCEVIALPTKVTYDDGNTKDYALPVAMCGYHGFIRTIPAESIALMKTYAAYMPVFALPHAGKEYVAAADSYKQATYRSMIDAGADMVLGDHPHWVQNSEAYKGHLIVYSMGNFIFDQQLRPEMTRSAAIDVTMRVADADSSLLQAWAELGKSCERYHDTCLEQIKSQHLAKLPFRYAIKVVATDDYNRLAKPASAETQAAVLQRLDWNKTAVGLQAPYQAVQ